MTLIIHFISLAYNAKNQFPLSFNMCDALQIDEAYHPQILILSFEYIIQSLFLLFQVLQRELETKLYEFLTVKRKKQELRDHQCL